MMTDLQKVKVIIVKRIGFIIHVVKLKWIYLNQNKNRYLY